MDFPSSFFVPQELFFLFHKMDRDLYTILVTNLCRDPVESMQILAMWLWLERVGFPNMVKKIMSLPFILINEVADETLIFLGCVNNGIALTPSSYSEGNEIPLLQSIMDKEISLQFFCDDRIKAIQGMEKVGQEVCVKAFNDIMHQAIIRNTVEKTKSVNNFGFGPIGPSNKRPAVGNIVVGVRGGELVVQNNNYGGVPADDRTLFVTFSKGYPVEEWEVREFFTTTYGDCIEALNMQEVQPTEQALFARIVFHKVSTIDMILRGATKAKISINGKHVWARKFAKKRATTTKTLLPSSLGDTSGQI